MDKPTQYNNCNFHSLLTLLAKRAPSSQYHLGLTSKLNRPYTGEVM